MDELAGYNPVYKSLFNIFWERFCVLPSILKLSYQSSVDIQFNFWLLFWEVLYPGYLFLDKNNLSITSLLGLLATSDLYINHIETHIDKA